MTEHAFRDRLPPIPPEEQNEPQRRATAEFVRTRQSEVFGPFVALLRSPEMMLRVSALGEQVRYRSSLPRRLTELVVLIVAREWTQQFEWIVHEPIARDAGLSDATLAAIRHRQRPEGLPADEQAVFDLCGELHRTGRIGDRTYARAIAALGAEGVMDAVVTAGYYTLLAMVMNTAETALPAGVSPPLALDEFALGGEPPDMSG